MEQSAQEDRISQLPDEIIHRILYLCNSPAAVARTSTLSRRWLHLWRTYPVLEFCHWDFLLVNGDLRVKFGSFVASSSKRLLAQQQKPPPRHPLLLEAVRIWALNPQLHDCAETLENYNLVDLSAIEIVVCLPNPQNAVFSLDISRTRVLDLLHVNLDALKIPANVGLERLEVLHLYSVTLKSENDLSILTSLCSAPNLVTLNLRLDCQARELKTRLEIVPSKKLKSLEVKCFNDPLELSIISAPLLHTLDIDVPDSQVKLAVESSSSAPSVRGLRLQYYKHSPFTQSHLDHLLRNFPSLRYLSLAIGSFRGFGVGMQRASPDCEF